MPFIEVPTRRATFAGQCVLALVLIALAATHAGAIAPPFIPDDELARKPIIVIGKWNKAPLKERSRTEDVPGSGKVCRECEIHTALLVERVIAGDIKPGAHKMLLGCFTGWPREDGGPLVSFTSTQMMGDVEQVADSNLWFLVPKKSWDKTDATTYLALDTYRGVQPLQLERYFRALRAEKPKEEVPRLLASNEPVIIERVLRYLNGDVLPWPYEPDFIDRHQGVKRRWDPMTQFAGEVEKLLQRRQPEVRRKAAAVYAAFAGKNSLPRMRQLLGDADVPMRGIAIGILARHDDRGSSDVICRAMRGNRDWHMASEIIESFVAWRNLQTIPALIEFLENNNAETALEAQAALRKLTAHDFPPDVESAQKAWGKAKLIADGKKRAAYLSELLPYDSQPLVAKVIKEGKDTAIVLTNRSSKAVLVAKEPTGIDYIAEGPEYYSNSYEGYQLEQVKSKDAFVSLAPGATLRIKTHTGWPDHSLLKRVTVHFLDTGRHLGLRAWIGRVLLVLDAKKAPAG